MTLNRLLRAFFTKLATCNAGKPAEGKGAEDLGPSGRPVIAPPRGARAEREENDDDGADDDDDEPAGDDDDAAGEDEGGDEDEDDDTADDEDADDDSDEDADEDDDEEDGDDADDDGEGDLDETTQTLRETVEARLEASQERDPDFGVSLNFRGAALKPEQRAEFVKRLAAGADDDEDGGKARRRDAEAILDVAQDVAKAMVHDLLGQYHVAAGAPTMAEVHKAKTSASVNKRLGELETKFGAKVAHPKVQAAMARLYEEWKRKYGETRALTVDFATIYRCVPKRIRDMAAAAAKKDGKGERRERRQREGSEEAEGRRERREALESTRAPGALGRLRTSKSGRRRMSKDDENRASMARHLTSGAFGKLF